MLIKVKAESLVPMTDPTNGTNSLKPGVSKYEVRAEDGDVSYCWNINTLERIWSKPRGVFIPRAMKEKLSNMFINCIISDQDDKVKTESLVPMTAPTNGTNSLMPGVPKYVANAEDED